MAPLKIPLCGCAHVILYSTCTSLAQYREILKDYREILKDEETHRQKK